MNDTESSRKLTWVIWLLGANLIVMAIAASAMVFGLLPKIECAIQTTERVEARFQAFADEVQPVLTAGAGKAIETITKMDADKLSETAVQIFRDRGIDVDFQPDVGKDKEKLAEINAVPLVLPSLDKPSIVGHLKADNVGLTVGDDRILFSNLSFDVKPGECLATPPY